MTVFDCSAPFGLGGAISAKKADVEISDSSFTRCNSTLGGGAISVDG